MFINLRGVCTAFALLAIVGGGLGMAASFLVLASSKISENIAGAAGFIAGALLVGSGLISLTLLAVRDPRHVPQSLDFSTKTEAFTVRP